MGLFENLFKPRPDGTLERIVEAPLKASGLAERRADAEGEATPDPAAAFLQPKGYATGATTPGIGAQNQGFVPVLPAAKRTHLPERKTPPAPDSDAEPSMVILTVGDVLPRIPVSFLRPGSHDLKRELRFHIDDLASDITRGRPAIALSCIADQAPELFHSPIRDTDDMAIRLPLQKLVEQVGRIRAHAPPLMSHPPPPAVRLPVAAEPEKPQSEATAPVSPPPALSPRPPAVRLPISPPVEKARFETPAPVSPLPAAEAPAIPPPVFRPPAATAPPSILPVAPLPAVAAAPVVPPPVAIPPPSVPIAVSQPEPAVAPQAPLAAHVLAPLEPPPGRTKEPAPAPEIPAPVASAAIVPEEPEAELPPEPPPARSRATPVAPLIDLSLAAIVAKLPRELLSGPLPQIDESHRVSLPFPMIERQLGTGTVEIPSKLFWSALPPLLKHHFVAREGLSVALPLEEIFQNLPVGRSEKLRFEPVDTTLFRPSEVEPPIVLAPAHVDDATPELHFEAPAPAPSAEPEPVPAAGVAVAPTPTLVVEPEAKLPAAAVPPPSPVAEPAPTLEPLVPPPVLIPEPAAALAEDFVLTGASAAEAAEPSPASAAPADEEAATVQLQPFRVFHPPSPAVESEPAPEPAVGLGEEAAAPAAATVEVVPVAPPAIEPATVPEADVKLPVAEVPEPREEPAAAPEPPPPVAEEPKPVEEPAPEPAPTEAPAAKFSVLPSPVPEPEPAALPPEIEPLVAFTPDQPPPLKIEVPAAAVAVLRATVPAPVVQPAVAMATGNIQPPRMFRPVVLPPPISGHDAAAPVNLAPILAGPGSTAGMISLSPAPAERAEPMFTPPPEPPVRPPEPAVEPPAATVPEPAAATEPRPAVRKPKNRPRENFSTPEPPSEPAPAPPAPAAAAPAPSPAPVASAAPSEPSSQQLSPPPLPPAAPVPLTPIDHSPPAATPKSRFDQISLQTLFMTEEALDLPKVSRLAAALPGLQGCVIVSQGETFSSGLLPEGFRLNDLRGLAPQVGAAADRLPIGALKNFTLYGEQYSISFFERPAVCLCAIHRARSFVPGVREKLVAVVDELARSEAARSEG